MREFLIDLQDLFHSIYINGGTEDLDDAKARELMRETARRGIDALDVTIETGEPTEIPT